MAVKTHVENRLLCPHNTLTKAFTMNVEFLRGFPLRSVKTGEEQAMTSDKNVKTEYSLTFIEGDEETPSGYWTVIDTEIGDGPFATEQAAHDFMASR